MRNFNANVKALALIKDFDVIHYVQLSKGRNLPVNMHRNQVIQCAIRHVEGILELPVVWFPMELVIDYPRRYKPECAFEFWEAVKLELNRMLLQWEIKGSLK